MRKRLLTLVTALAIALSAVAPAFAAGFTDVTDNYSWAKAAIEELSQLEIIQGYPDNSFKPANSVSKQECIVLFARMMGYTEDLNGAVVEFAADTYAEEFAKLDTYASKEMSYLIYKRVLSVDDITNYLTDAAKDVAAKRYEAATLIAKALGADVWLKDNPTIDVGFADKDDIPSSALGYVQYATDLGIIMGMDENHFEPMGNVTRAQMAVMLKRMLDLMAFTYEKGNITEVNTDLSNVVIRTEDGSSQTLKVGKGVAVLVDGEVSPMSLLKAGMEAVITYSQDKLYSIDALNIVSDSEIEGSFVTYTKDNSKTVIKVTPVGESSANAETYTVADDAVIQYEGEKAALSSFKRGDFVKLTMKNGKAAIVEGKAMTDKLSNCVVEEIAFDPAVQITVRTSDNEVKTFEVLSDATLRRNGVTTEFANLAVGDRVTLTLEYDRVAYVDATGTQKTLEGSLTEITISTTPAITIKSGGDTQSYTLSRDVKITLDDESATIYDLRLGYEVKVITSSSQVKEIIVKSVTPPMSITGQITLVNSAYGMIKVSSTDSNGDITEQQIFIKSNAKILDSSDNKIKDVDDLKAGMLVTVAGAVNTGVFEATSVMILNTDE